jgi:hypothetical protein
MAIRRRCRGSCRSARRCLEHLWFDVKHRGMRYRMPVNDFAVPADGADQAATSAVDGGSTRLGAAIHR